MLCSTLPAARGDTPVVDLTVEQTLTLATRALERGQIDTAKRLVALLERAGVDHPQLLFLKGQIALAEGRLPDAISAFRALLDRDPSLMRVRLELARALYLARDFDAARYHFKLALGAPDLPDAARSNVLAYLREIEAQTTALRLRLAVLSDSNPNQSTRAENIVILGQTFRLAEAAQAQPSLGLGVTADARAALGATSQAFVRGHLEWRDFPNNYADFGYASGTAGYTFFWDQQWLAVEAGPQIAGYQGRQLYDGALAMATHFAPLSQRWSLRQTLSVMSLRYQNYAYLDGWLAWLDEDARYAVSNRSAVLFGLGLGWRDASEQAYAYTAAEGHFGYLSELGAGFIGEWRLTVGSLDFRADAPLFGKARRDTYERAEMRLTNRRWTLWDFAPQLQVGYWNNDSSISLYAFDRWYVELGLTADF
jgi:tetratricopeptide (TPR) repeat protein